MSNTTTVQSWFTAVVGAAGHSERVKEGFIRRVQESGIPAITVGAVRRSAGLGHAIKGMFKGTSHGAMEFTEIENESLPGYVIHAGSRDYGKLLLVSWYLVADKSKLPAMAKLAGAATLGRMDFLELSVYESEELSAFSSLVHEALKGSVAEVMGSLNLDFSKVDTKTRGLINLS
jgi:hypothetical protein